MVVSLQLAFNHFITSVANLWGQGLHFTIKHVTLLRKKLDHDSHWACSVWVCWSFLAGNVCVQTCGGVSWVFHPPSLHSPGCRSRHLFPYQMPHQSWDYKRSFKHLITSKLVTQSYKSLKSVKNLTPTCHRRNWVKILVCPEAHPEDNKIGRCKTVSRARWRFYFIQNGSLQDYRAVVLMLICAISFWPLRVISVSGVEVAFKMGWRYETDVNVIWTCFLNNN